MNTELQKQVKIDLKKLKENGFLQQVQPDRFALRVMVVGGQLAAEKLQVINEIAQQYGNGNVHFTSRQAVEVPFIKTEDIEHVRSILQANGLEPGILGDRVRTVTACQGKDICKHGKIQTTDLARKITATTMGLELPHKLKIGVTGCCNNCLKAEENDLGIKGGVQPSWLEAQCTFCGACKVKCPVKAISVNKSKQKLTYKQEKCINCGKCVQICPTKAWIGTPGFLIFFGGTFGNRILIGKRLLPIVFSDDQVLERVNQALKFYREHGKKGERFGFMLERVGLDKLQTTLQSGLQEG